MTTGCIPFVETPEFDCLDALMSFDAAAAEEHELFARRFYIFELTFSPTEAEPEPLNLTVVQRLAPGVRFRRFIHAPRWPREPIFLAADFFSLEELEPLCLPRS